MNKEKLRLGTKIKLVKDVMDLPSGTIGYLSDESVFCIKGQFLDAIGCPWAMFKNSKYNCYCLSVDCSQFRVLKY